MGEQEQEDSPQVIHPENSFIELFDAEDNAAMQIIDTLLDHPTLEYTKKDLAEVNNLTDKQLKNCWQTLVDHDIVQKKGEKRGETTYRLQDHNQIVEQLYKLSDAVMTYRRREGFADTELIKEE